MIPNRMARVEKTRLTFLNYKASVFLDANNNEFKIVVSGQPVLYATRAPVFSLL